MTANHQNDHVNQNQNIKEKLQQQALANNLYLTHLQDIEQDLEAVFKAFTSSKTI